jgi:hypothetical protein
VHGNCYDGHGAAWVAKKFMEDAVIYYANHGDPIPPVPDGCLCWMIDISWPRKQMLELAQRVSLRVLDHHKSAQAALEGFPNAVFDMDKSGAMLAWLEFIGNTTPPPRLIEYVQDQDLWTWTMPNSSEVCSYIRSFPRTIEAWTELEEQLEDPELNDQIVAIGAAIMRSDRQKVQEMCDQAFFATIGGHSVPVANATTQFSAVGHELCKRYPDAKFAAYFMDRADGQRQWGLRSIGEFDVSEIAKKYGGGGHKNASGFQTERPEGSPDYWVALSYDR